jgi:hypothetical protein
VAFGRVHASSQPESLPFPRATGQSDNMRASMQVIAAFENCSPYSLIARGALGDRALMR